MAFGLKTGWFTGLNWWKLGAYALVVAMLVGGGYMVGKHRCELKHEQQATAAQKEIVRTVVKEVEVRVPVVQEREVASATQRAEIARLKKELFNATAKRPENPSCDLSDAEFNLMQQLAAQTRTP